MITNDLESLARRLAEITVQIRAGRESVGCGIIWSSAGLIVTNAHVAQSNSLTVELVDGRVLDGRVRWRHPRRDLAGVAVAASGLPTPVVADPSRLRSGEIAVALGHPLGLANGLALGIVQSTETTNARNQWLRADIRLAPGNSGGPLANAVGELLGINTLIAGGLAYAIPATAVQRYLDEIGARAA
jgi:serine protease Do